MKPDKRIFEMFTGETSRGKVIHHMIEQQMDVVVGVMTEAFIQRLQNNPYRNAARESIRNSMR